MVFLSQKKSCPTSSPAIISGLVSLAQGLNESKKKKKKFPLTSGKGTEPSLKMMPVLRKPLAQGVGHIKYRGFQYEKYAELKKRQEGRS